MKREYERFGQFIKGSDIISLESGEAIIRYYFAFIRKKVL